jgi:hypothetical protein
MASVKDLPKRSLLILIKRELQTSRFDHFLLQYATLYHKQLLAFFIDIDASMYKHSFAPQFEYDAETGIYLQQKVRERYSDMKL